MSSEENGYANPDVLVSTKWLADNLEDATSSKQNQQTKPANKKGAMPMRTSPLLFNSGCWRF